MEKILASVAGATITEGDVTSFLQALGKRGAAYNNPEGRRMVLEKLIGDKLLLLDAKRNLLEADPEFRAELAKLKDTLLVNFATERAMRDVKVSAKEVEDYYNENQDKFVQGEKVNASHILVDSEELALELIAKIKAGEIEFEKAAMENSSCPSKENGGSLGDFERGQMVPEFDAAVFEMKVGEITEAPVKTQFGYHIIKLNSKSEASVAPLSEIRDRLEAVLLDEKRQKAYESKINQLRIMYPVDMTV